MRFSIDLSQFNATTLDQADMIRRKVIMDVSGRVIRRTPVDKGHARGGWQATTGSPATADNESTADPMPEVRRVVGQSRAGETVYLTNLVPYIGKLEWGGYPNPPEKGSYVPKRHGGPRYEIKTVGGFSKQAPRGMMRVSIAEFPYIVVEEARGTNFE